MKIEIVIPSMGESVTEATIGRFIKSSGEGVKEGEEILELETEKVNQLLYAPASGVIQWSVEEGDIAPIGKKIGSVDSEAAAIPTKAPEPKPKQVVHPSEKVSPGEAIRVSPEAWIKKEEKPTPLVSEISKESNARETRKPMSKIRQTIAKRLVESLHQAAMLTTFNEVDMSAVIDLRARHQESFTKKHQVKLGFMSFFVKAVLEGLKSIPSLNAYIDEKEIVQRLTYDIGIAISSERGLVVPVLRDADHSSFGQIEQSIATYAKKAREGGLSPDDLIGGGFTITNGGVFGSLLSTPLLNPPQSGILGMHKIEKRAVVISDQIVIRPMMYLALSYDHRIIDGKEAITFLVRVKEVLEDPSLLLFNGE